jgi:hypothetical protein
MSEMGRILPEGKRQKQTLRTPSTEIGLRLEALLRDRGVFT